MPKYRIAFTASAEMILGMMARMLPDALQIDVQEVPEEAPPKAAPKIVAHLAARSAPAIGKSKPPRRKRRNDRFDLKGGINGVIMTVLEDGKEHHPNEMEPPAKARGYSANSISSRLQSLKERGHVFQPRIGFWQASENTLAVLRTAAAP